MAGSSRKGVTVVTMQEVQEVQEVQQFGTLPRSGGTHVVIGADAQRIAQRIAQDIENVFWGTCRVDCTGADACAAYVRWSVPTCLEERLRWWLGGVVSGMCALRL